MNDEKTGRDPRTERDHLLTIARAVRSYLPKSTEVDAMGLRTTLEALDAILARYAPAPAEAPAAPFRRWDIVANRHGPASSLGFPLRYGSCQYADAIVACVSPLVLVSRDGFMRWDDISEADRAHLVVVRPASNVEAGPAFMRMRDDFNAALAATGT